MLANSYPLYFLYIEIRTLRHGLWTHVLRRKHVPKTVAFVNDTELMLYGVVRYVLRSGDGEEVEVPWGGRVVFGDGKDGQGLRMRFYQVYLVCFFLFSLLGWVGRWEG